MRKSKIYRTYGIKIDSLPDTCQICDNSDQRICVDHDHLTGEVRGFLCIKCNSALGMVGDSIEILQALINYLNNPGVSFNESHTRRKS